MYYLHACLSPHNLHWLWTLEFIHYLFSRSCVTRLKFAVVPQLALGQLPDDLSHTRTVRPVSFSLSQQSAWENQNWESVDIPHIDAHSLLAWWFLAKETAFLIPLLLQKRTQWSMGFRSSVKLQLLLLCSALIYQRFSILPWAQKSLWLFKISWPLEWNVRSLMFCQTGLVLVRRKPGGYSRHI